VVAGIFLAVQVTLGTNNVGVSFPLPAFTACFLGGATLAGGRGVFIGVLLGTVLLSMLNNIAPLLGWPQATSTVITGVLTVIAVMAYADYRRAGARRRRRGKGGGTSSSLVAPDSGSEEAVA
jgi:ribose/xylose/arabinose/galactoside ABC-type transport system permease subunit